MTTIQDLIKQWRVIAKQVAQVNPALKPVPGEQPVRDAVALTMNRCADDLEKALAGIASPTGGGVAS